MCCPCCPVVPPLVVFQVAQRGSDCHVAADEQHDMRASPSSSPPPLGFHNVLCRLEVSIPDHKGAAVKGC